MQDICRWHGCLLVVWAVAATAPAAPPAGPQTTRVRSKVFDIEYRINPQAMPLDTVRLWYTADKGSTWQLYGADQDRQPPVRFNAPGEGLYGFYFVATNAAGASGPEPQAGTTAQRWAYVDHTPPVVQLHRPQVRPPRADGNTVSIRWSAIDAHLPPRPVTLAYRVAPDGKWHPIAARVANTGRYDWSAPGDLQGRVVLRITVVDQGGNRVEAASTFDLAPGRDALGQTTPNDEADTVAQLTGRQHVIDEKARTRSRQLYQAAIWQRQRGANQLAKARLRDALELDPTFSTALVDLASLLYAEGDYQASLEAHRLALKQEPYLRSGLQGVAKASIAMRNYAQAAEYLDRIIRQNPKDVEAWLNLGDVAIYRGDQLAAREHYQKAATLDPAATEVITQAQLRLNDLTWLRRQYQQTAATP